MVIVEWFCYGIKSGQYIDGGPNVWLSFNYVIWLMNREFNLGSTPSAQKCEFNKFYTQSLTFKQIFVKLFSNLTSKQLFFKQKQIFSMLCFLKSKIARNH